MLHNSDPSLTSLELQPILRDVKGSISRNCIRCSGSYVEAETLSAFLETIQKVLKPYFLPFSMSLTRTSYHRSAPQFPNIPHIIHTLCISHHSKRLSTSSMQFGIITITTTLLATSVLTTHELGSLCSDAKNYRPYGCSNDECSVARKPLSIRLTAVLRLGLTNQPDSMCSKRQ